MEVLIEIKDNDAASFPFNTSVIKDHLAGKGNFEYFPFIEIVSFFCYSLFTFFKPLL